MDFFEQKFNAEDLQTGQVFLIDKPLGWTSFQVINKIRWHLKNQTGIKKLKVGHAGTLDPLATGLMIVCTGKKTKTINEFQNKMKTYTGTFTVGGTTPSYDMETEIDNRFPINHISENLIQKAVKSLTGEIKQFPPIFSALKIKGKRLYEYARSGEDVEIQPRSVIISRFEITNTELPLVDFLIQCNKGTYIRSIAHDFGKKLESGAYLSNLRRIQNGAQSIEDAYSMESVIDKYSEKNTRSIKQIN